MNRKLLPIPLAISFLMLTALFWLVSAASASLQADETPLNELGNAYEINVDHQGAMWVSDNGAGEVRAYNSVTGVYTTYLGMGAPSDARRAPSGEVWWADQDTGQLGVLEPGTNAVTRWDLPATPPYGTAVDSTGTVWVTDHFHPNIYSFDLDTSQLCTYTFGTAGASDYVLAQNGDIWLGDWINDGVYRMEVGTNSLTSWELPFNARPVGLTMDSQGNFWWADSDRGDLNQLEPDLNRLTVFNPPAASTPEMLISSGDNIWYTDDEYQRIGSLSPLLASGSSQTISKAETTLVPECATISPASTGTANITSGTTDWSSVSYTATIASGGWLMYELPSDAYPWGIAAGNDQIWFVDNGRQMLSRFTEKTSVTACKLVDADGELGTEDDQEPFEGWMVYLVVDGIRQMPGQLTGEDGCYTWYDLDGGKSYGVEEDLPQSWGALTPTSHSFGTGSPGDVFSYTFINYELTGGIYLPLVVK